MMTILANIRINSEERFQHMKDSFNSFDSTSNNWLINVRGSYREKAHDFLKTRLGNKMIEFKLLDDNRGWIKNALDMIDEAKHEYIFCWIEDHINLAPQKRYKTILKEMINTDSDYLLYTWWGFGESRKAFSSISTTHHSTIDTINLTRDAWQQIRNVGHDYYLISLAGIFKKTFLRQMMEKDVKIWPRLISKLVYKTLRTWNQIHKINVDDVFAKTDIFLGNKLCKYPKQTPFNLEKDAYRHDMLPLHLAITNQELFCCIDDNLGTPGSCLIERGLYPNKK